MEFARSVGRWGRIGALFAAIAAPISPAADSPSSQSLDIRSVSLAANRDIPELCLELSEAVGHRPNAPLESYVASDPAARLSVSTHGRHLCISGLAFGATYTLTLKS